MLSDSLKTFYRSAAATYAAALTKSDTALTYLAKRGLSEGSATSFQLGYVESPLTGHEQYAGRLAIPYLTRSGVCGIAFRCIEHDDCKPVHKDKYLWPSGLDRRIYNTPAFDVPSPHIAICEGEIDAMTAHQEVMPAVGIPGADAFKEWWALPFLGYDTVYVLTDDDDAGHALGQKICRYIPQARPVVMPPDVNSFYLAEGSDALRARIGING